MESSKARHVEGEKTEELILEASPLEREQEEQDPELISDHFNLPSLPPERRDIFLASPCRKDAKYLEIFEHIKRGFDLDDKAKQFKQYLIGSEEDRTLAEYEYRVVYHNYAVGGGGPKSWKHSLDREVISIGHTYIINIPSHKYARVVIEDQPFLLQPGPHVFHSESFQFHWLVDAKPYVNFRWARSLKAPHTEAPNDRKSKINYSIHVLKVPKGKEAKISNGQYGFVLAARDKPYVYMDVFKGKGPNLRFNGMQLVKPLQNDPLQERGKLVIQPSPVSLPPLPNIIYYSHPFKIIDNYCSDELSNKVQAEELPEELKPGAILSQNAQLAAVLEDESESETKLDQGPRVSTNSNALFSSHSSSSLDENKENNEALEQEALVSLYFNSLFSSSSQSRLDDRKRNDNDEENSWDLIEDAVVEDTMSVLGSPKAVKQ